MKFITIDISENDTNIHYFEVRWTYGDQSLLAEPRTFSSQEAALTHALAWKDQGYIVNLIIDGMTIIEHIDDDEELAA